ncbi:MAG: aminopeptidase P family protein [Bdellovibrionaceae bacterium]|nr:aminopeptidase P family protein [Pseudobdellovibrionaceae bacterium]
MKNRTYTNLKEFQNRREKIMDALKDSVMILFSGEEGAWERFRADSSFVYATGFEEPDAICVFAPKNEKPFQMFVRPRDPAKEIWDGYRYGLEGVKKDFGADASHDISLFYTLLPSLLAGAERVYYSLQGGERDLQVIRAVKQYVTTQGRTGRGVLPIHDTKDLLGELRLIKSAQEIEWMKESCEISGQSHKTLMASVKPGMNEKEMQAILFKEFYSRQAHREGYFSIIAAGANATILHYRDNNSPSKDGDLLLVDAGAEKNYYTADITRTYPLNGKFNDAQKDIYSRVLRVQKQLIEMVKPGVAFVDIQDATREKLTQELIEVGFLKGTIAENLKSKAYSKYYPHNVSHFLGMDVHDTGLYSVNGTSRKLEAGMMLTIEPGLYIPVDDATVPAEYRGIGIRIEDDILVTASGHEVMTSSAPKEIADIEAVMANTTLSLT